MIYSFSEIESRVECCFKIGMCLMMMTDDQKRDFICRCRLEFEVLEMPDRIADLSNYRHLCTVVPRSPPLTGKVYGFVDLGVQPMDPEGDDDDAWGYVTR
jgi:hypothetical protein